MDLQKWLIGLLVCGGVWVLVENIKSHHLFEKYCQKVADIKGERDLLESPYGGVDLGYNGYRAKIHEMLEDGEADSSLPGDVQDQGRNVGSLLSRTRAVTFVFVVVMIFCGLIFGWG